MFKTTNINTIAPDRSLATKGRRKLHRFRFQLELQSMVLPGLMLILVFNYAPMYGIIIAFKEYSIISGIWEAPWVGLQYFHEIFTDANMLNALRNSIGINLLQLLIGFPSAIIFALLLNELTKPWFKRLTQTLSYLPHFISWVIYGGLVMMFLNPNTGILNAILVKLGVLNEPIYFLAEPQYFWITMVTAGVVKNLGWSAILYLAAISGVDTQLYDSAEVDGAGRFKKMWHVTLPAIAPTIVIMLILEISKILKTWFEPVWMLQNGLNISASETIETYVYKLGLQNMQFSYAAAVGLTQSIIAVILLTCANYISRKTTEHGLY